MNLEMVGKQQGNGQVTQPQMAHSSSPNDNLNNLAVISHQERNSDTGNLMIVDRSGGLEKGSYTVFASEK